MLTLFDLKKLIELEENKKEVEAYLQKFNKAQIVEALKAKFG